MAAKVHTQLESHTYAHQLGSSGDKVKLSVCKYRQTQTQEQLVGCGLASGCVCNWRVQRGAGWGGCLLRTKVVSEVDAGRDRATDASVGEIR